MLYKKVHRQYLRQFRIGRKFWYCGFVHEVAKEPYISKKEECIYFNGDKLRWYLIPLGGSSKGRLLNTCIFEWID